MGKQRPDRQLDAVECVNGGDGTTDTGYPNKPIRVIVGPIGQLLTMPSILAVNNEVPAKTVQDLLALAKA